MIKSICAATREADDARAAVAEITAGLDLENHLLANSIGIISCFSDFDETGVLKEICEALPFDCIGATTCLGAVGTEIDQIIFTITVLTSDDCRFEAAMIPIDNNAKGADSKALSDFLQKNKTMPAMMLSYFPMMTEVSGDMIMASIEKVTGGVPLFGTAAVDHTMDYSTAKTIYNGVAFREAAILCAIYGEPHVTYEVAALNEDKVRKQKAIITASNGNILIEVNGKTALEYLEEIGLTKQELATGLGIVPLVVDHQDGTKPVARAVFGLTDEGYAFCGGAMPEGATLAIGRVDFEDVLSTTESSLRPLADKDSLVLSYSCMARYLSLGADYSAEAEMMRETAGGAPYHFACSGGEICPLPDADGKLRNFYHNYTNVFCKIN
ncbi:MAG: FIST C-terminal domain-containing protein [Oscillospiraceae bacterium]|nr:FIST C-terminal domain-containing protein [Oscillospiraceae bacterium]